MIRRMRTACSAAFLAGVLLWLSGCRSTAPEGPGNAEPEGGLPVPHCRILLDPGHGGEELGAVRNLLPEKHLNLLLAREIRRELMRRGFAVQMTRDGDFTVSLRQRQIMAEALRPDLLISVHHNAALSTAANGVECYIRTPSDPDAQRFWERSFPLARKIQQGIVAQLPGVCDRGVKNARFAVLIPKRPAVLIEVGFVSNPREELELHTAERRRRTALGVADGVEAFLTGEAKGIVRL